MIYIVIPVFNRKSLTRGCLASLRNQNYSDFTVIVVDDGSTDGTSEMIREEFPDVVLLHGDGDLWWVGSINKGIQHALDVCQADDYILVINDDLTVSPNYLSNLLATAHQHEGAIIGSVETTMDAPRTIKSGGGRVNWATAKYSRLNKGQNLDEFPNGFAVEVSKLTGRGTLFSSQVFRDVGLYDNLHFKQCGDTELPVRAKLKNGYKLVVSYDAVVVSHVSKKSDINSQQRYTIRDARQYFFDLRSHYNLKDHFWFAYKVAPNAFWFARFVTLEFLRNVGHFVLRLRFLNTPTRRQTSQS